MGTLPPLPAYLVAGGRYELLDHLGAAAWRRCTAPYTATSATVAALERAMSRDPERRFADAGAMAAAVRDLTARPADCFRLA